MERSHNIRSWHLCIFTAGFVEVDPELNTNQVHYIRLRLLNRQKEQCTCSCQRTYQEIHQ